MDRITGTPVESNNCVTVGLYENVCLHLSVQQGVAAVGCCRLMPYFQIAQVMLCADVTYV